jgi:hypothetical protein
MRTTERLRHSINRNGFKSLGWSFSAPNQRLEAAEKVDIRRSAPKGAFDFERLAVSLKRYPDTKLEFFSSLGKPGI